MFADADLESQAAPSPQSRSRESAPVDSTLVSRIREGLTHSDRGAALVVLLHLLPVWWLVSGGGLYLDDLRAQAYARNQPFWSFIVGSNGTHLAPGARTVDWLQMQYAPLEISAGAVGVQRFRLPTPGPCTSIAMKSLCGCACAISIVVSPIPEPISTTSGALRPKIQRASIGLAENGMPYFGNNSSSARRCAGVVLLWRRT